MKKIKGFIALLLAMLMVMGLSTTVMADGEEKFTITIKNDSSAHTYEAYQIFTGDLANGKLSNIQWGNGVRVDGQTALGDPAVKASTLTDETAAKAFAVEVVQYLASKAIVSSEFDSQNKQYTISNLPEGYYLIKDKDNSLTGDNSSYTTYILRLAANETITPKSEIPTSHKKVDDTHDSSSSENAVFWQDSADYDIGDKVPFLLTGTLPSNYGEYTSYKMVFHDEQSAGLTFNRDSVKVYVKNLSGREEVKTGYEVNYPVSHIERDTNEDETWNCTFEVKLENLRNLRDEEGNHIPTTKNSIIEVEYTSTLNENAQIGSQGNPNTMYMEYSNNPNKESEGETGKTERDTVIVFTYKTVLNKVDGEGNALPGAAFKLEKRFETLENGNKVYEWREIKKYPTKAEATLKGETLTTTTFEFVGLDDGNYRITEIETPAGYNSIAPFYFEIIAQHEQESDNPKLTVLHSNQIDEAGLTVTENIIFSATVEKTVTDNNTIYSGVISSNIVNQSGATLPSTGGIGRTIFYVAGAILMVGAGVVLVTRRRMMNE